MAWSCRKSPRASATDIAHGPSARRPSRGSGRSARRTSRRFGDATPPDGPILAVRVEDLGEKEAVLAANPRSFFTIPHFDGYSAVLIQLKTVGKRALREAIVDGWLACAPSKLADAYIEREASRRRRRRSLRAESVGDTETARPSVPGTPRSC